jgi:hypothetical protein
MLKWILIIFAVFVILGALGGSEDQTPTEKTKATNGIDTAAQSADTVTQPNNKDTAVEQPSQNTNAKTTTTEAYQDSEWVDSTEEQTSLISASMDTILQMENVDYSELEANAVNFAEITGAALEESRQYTVSSKYQESKNEWELALIDYSTAGRFMAVAANDMSMGKSSTESIESATFYLKSGGIHIGRASELIEAAE